MWYIHSVICIAIAVVGKDAVTGVFLLFKHFMQSIICIFSRCLPSVSPRLLRSDGAQYLHDVPLTLYL